MLVDSSESLRLAAVMAAVLLAQGCDGGDGGGDRAPKPDPGSGQCQLDETAAPVRIGGIFTLTQGGSTNTQAANKDQLDFLVTEVNLGCGLTGDANQGTRAEALFRDGQDSKDLTPGLTTELIGAGAAVLVGAGGSSSTTPAAATAVAAGVPFGAYFATGDELTGCTAAQVADSGVEKGNTPVFAEGKCWQHGGLFFRTSTLSTIWGKTAAKYALENYPATDAPRAAVIYRNDSFGRPIEATFSAEFGAAAGRAITQRIGYSEGAGVEEFKKLIGGDPANPSKPYLAQGDPLLVLGVWRIGELKAFMQAYVELRADTAFSANKPAHYDNIVFLHTGSVRASYSDLSDDALEVMASRSTGLEPYYDPDSTGFAKWVTAYQAYDPDGTVTVHTQMRTYDALMVLALAIVKANSTAGADIEAQLVAVSNPPGDTVYPGEFAKARALLMAGTDVNYEGASGPVDLNETGNIKTTPYQVWRVKSEAGQQGTPYLVEAYAAAE